MLLKFFSRICPVFIWICFGQVEAIASSLIQQSVLPLVTDENRQEVNMNALWREDIPFLEGKRQLQFQIITPSKPGKYPLIIFSGGWNVNFRHYSYLLERVAEKGYIILNIDHYYQKDTLTHSSAEDEQILQWKKELKGQPSQLKDERLYLTKQRVLKVFHDDILFVLRNLSEILPDTLPADLSKIILMGHSLGGNASTKVVESLSYLPHTTTLKRHIKACIALDSRFNQLNLEPQFEKPTLLLGAGEEYKIYDSARDVRSQPNLKLILLPRARHVTFMDYVIFHFLKKDEEILMQHLNQSARKDTLKLMGRVKKAPNKFFNGTADQLQGCLQQAIEYIDQFLHDNI